MPRVCLLSLVAVFSFSMLAEDNVQTGKPRKLLVGDYSKKLCALINEKNEIEWQHPIGAIHDAWLLKNGNVLFQTSWTNIIEMNPKDKSIVWKYDAAKMNGNDGKPVEVHAFQRLENGHTMIVESGPARIIEVDKDGKIQKEVKLKVDKPHAHTDTRLARKLDNGNYLVCHEADLWVREYDSKGDVVWKYEVGSKVYSATRLKNGNTLIGSGNGSRVIEVDKDGKTVWEIGKNELPGCTLGWITMCERLANGNTVITNCHGGVNNPQIVEVTPDKKIVWSFKDFNRFGDALPVCQTLGNEGEVAR